MILGGKRVGHVAQRTGYAVGDKPSCRRGLCCEPLLAILLATIANRIANSKWKNMRRSSQVWHPYKR